MNARDGETEGFRVGGMLSGYEYIKNVIVHVSWTKNCSADSNRGVGSLHEFKDEVL